MVELTYEKAVAIVRESFKTDAVESDADAHLPDQLVRSLVALGLLELLPSGE